MLQMLSFQRTLRNRSGDHLALLAGTCVNAVHHIGMQGTNNGPCASLTAFSATRTYPLACKKESLGQTRNHYPCHYQGCEWSRSTPVLPAASGRKYPGFVRLSLTISRYLDHCFSSCSSSTRTSGMSFPLSKIKPRATSDAELFRTCKMGGKGLA